MYSYGANTTRHNEVERIGKPALIPFSFEIKTFIKS